MPSNICIFNTYVAIVRSYCYGMVSFTQVLIYQLCSPMLATKGNPSNLFHRNKPVYLEYYT